MSKSRCSVQGAGCRAALVGLIILVLPRVLAAQSVAELEGTVRRLEIEVADAKQEEDSIRAIERRQGVARFVRFTIGGLELHTLPEIRSEVEEGGRQAWEAIAKTFQDSAAVYVRARPYAILPEHTDTTAKHKRLWYPEGTTLVFAPAGDRVRGVANALLAQVYQYIWFQIDPGLKTWMSGPPQVTTDVGRSLSGAYLDLATSASPAAQRCLLSPAACPDALGLTRTADPASTLYSPNGRRQLAVQLSATLAQGEDRPLYERCITGSDPDCLRLLRQVPEMIPPPLSAPTRATFLRVALQRGGSGSFPALLADAGTPIGQRIETASATPIEALVNDWHRQVIAARPPATALGEGQAFAAIGWMALLLTFALRSSRWR